MGRRRTACCVAAVTAALVAVMWTAAGWRPVLTAAGATRTVAGEARGAVISVAEPHAMVPGATLALLAGLSMALGGGPGPADREPRPSESSPDDGRRARWWARMVGAPPLDR